MNLPKYKRRRILFATAMVVVGMALFVQASVLVKNIAIEKSRNIWLEMEERVHVAHASRIDLLSPDEVGDLLVSAIIQVESGGNPRLVGSAGERGMMQIMPGTWAEMSARRFGTSLSFDRAFDATLNEQVGRTYLDYLQAFLRQHRDEWKSDERSLLLAAYNAGPGSLQQAGFDMNRLPASVKDYVQRGTDLHDFLLAEQADYIRHLLVSSRPASPSGG